MRLWTSRDCLEHRVPRGFPECPERLECLLDALGRLPGWEVLEADLSDVAAPWVRRVHDPAYVGRFENAVAAGESFLDSGDNPLSPGTWKAAWAAARVALAGLERVLAGDRTPSLLAVRPPGHHAERSQAMGFCFFNQAALLAERALAFPGIERVAIVDFDVHHGNGTQHLFEEREEVFFLSLHQYPFYPGTGAAHEVGRGKGVGKTRNLPLPAGTGDERYLEVFREIAVPEVERFRPDLLVVSAGFDAWRSDPLGGLALTEEAYGQIGSLLAGLAARSSQGRLVSVLEGGYDLDALPRLVEAFLGGCGTPA